MKKTSTHEEAFEDRDTMRPEYDFSGAARGATAARYTEGTNVVVVDPDVRDVFPNATSVNEALRALAPLLREQRDKNGFSRRRSTRSRPPRHSVKQGPSPAHGSGDQSPTAL